MPRGDLAIAMVSCISGGAYECPEELSDLQQWKQLAADRMCEFRQAMFTLPTVCRYKYHWKFSLLFHADSEGHCPYQSSMPLDWLQMLPDWSQMPHDWLQMLALIVRDTMRCDLIKSCGTWTLYCHPRNDCFSWILLTASQTAPMSHLGCSWCYTLLRSTSFVCCLWKRVSLCSQQLFVCCDVTCRKITRIPHGGFG